MPKHSLAILALLVAVIAGVVFVACPSCTGVPGYFETSRVRPSSVYVLGRHDGYVRNDLTLPEATRTAELAESDQVRHALEAPRADARTLREPLLNVCARHDRYVTADLTLAPIEVSTALAGSDVLRALVEPPK